jgi:hypothetical protein
VATAFSGVYARARRSLLFERSHIYTLASGRPPNHAMSTQQVASKSLSRPTSTNLRCAPRFSSPRAVRPGSGLVWVVLFRVLPPARARSRSPRAPARYVAARRLRLELYSNAAARRAAWSSPPGAARGPGEGGGQKKKGKRPSCSFLALWAGGRDGVVIVPYLCAPRPFSSSLGGPPPLVSLFRPTSGPARPRPPSLSPCRHGSLKNSPTPRFPDRAAPALAATLSYVASIALHRGFRGVTSETHRAPSFAVPLCLPATRRPRQIPSSAANRGAAFGRFQMDGPVGPFPFFVAFFSRFPVRSEMCLSRSAEVHKPVGLPGPRPPPPPPPPSPPLPSADHGAGRGHAHRFAPISPAYADRRYPPGEESSEESSLYVRNNRECKGGASEAR